MANLFSWFKRNGNRYARDSKAGSSATPSPSGGFPFLSLWGTAPPLTIATVYRCVKVISEAVANLPMRYMKQTNGGMFVDDTRGTLGYLLSTQPNATTNAFDFWQQCVQQILLEGNAYIVPELDPMTLDFGRLVLCSRGSVIHDTNNDVYTVNDTANHLSGTYAEGEIVHVMNTTVDGKNGISVLNFARLTSDIAGAGDKETLNRFTNGGNVRGLVSNYTSGTLGVQYRDEELTDTAATLDERFSRGEHIVALPGQAQFQPISLSSADMQFLESRKFTVREICRFFGVHPSFVFDDTSNNYKSAEMANVAFLSNTLNPILRKIECELQRKLVPRNLNAKRMFQFDRRGLYAADLLSRVDYQTKCLQAGLYTVNELRAEENRPPIDGGDTALVTANLMAISQITDKQQQVVTDTNSTQNEEGQE